VLALTALAVTMAAIANQSATPGDWPSTSRPVSAANSGLTLMKTPKNLAGTRRRASRSATIGTAEHMTPAVAARPRAMAVTGWLARTQMPTGMYSRADRAAAAAGPSEPGSRVPTTRFTPMYPAQQRAASRARKIPA
jgi:hypothetical protein